MSSVHGDKPTDTSSITQSYFDISSKEIKNPIAKLVIGILKFISYTTVIIPAAFAIAGLLGRVKKGAPNTKQKEKTAETAKQVFGKNSSKKTTKNTDTTQSTPPNSDQLSLEEILIVRTLVSGAIESAVKDASKPDPQKPAPKSITSDPATPITSNPSPVSNTEKPLEDLLKLYPSKPPTFEERLAEANVKVMRFISNLWPWK